MEQYAFDRILLKESAKIMAQEMPERVKEIRLSVVTETRKCLSRYARLGYMPELLCAIAEKKCAKLKTISTKEDAHRLSQPRCPAYTGNGFVQDDMIVPEEELICWSETSLQAPLNEVGFRRYMELFRQILPEKSKEINIDSKGEET